MLIDCRSFPLAIEKIMSLKTASQNLIFDRSLYASRLERAAKDFSHHQFLHEAMAEDIIDRLETVTYDFPKALLIGPGTHLIIERLTPACGLKSITEAQYASSWFSSSQETSKHLLQEEAEDLGSGEYDLIISMMDLHSINNVPAALTAYRRALKPNGLFLGALLGENTLTELRQSLYQAEDKILSGVSAHIHPMMKLKDLGGLLQGAGFSLPVADQQTIPVTYKNPMTLLQDLKNMGESNVMLNRRKTLLRRDILSSMKDIYREQFMMPSGEGVRATFDLLYLTGWAPHESQQKPLKPGSAKMSMVDGIKSMDGNS